MRRLWVQLVLRALVEGFQIGIVVWAALATLSVLGLRLSFAQRRESSFTFATEDIGHAEDGTSHRNQAAG